MSAATLIAISFNGETRDVPAGLMLSDVLRHAGLDPTQPGIAVAQNGDIVRRAAWTETEVERGDELEVITATQGG